MRKKKNQNLSSRINTQKKNETKQKTAKIADLRITVIGDNIIPAAHPVGAINHLPWERHANSK
jgi:hypothetical protein